jgi:hypothetical protein
MEKIDQYAKIIWDYMLMHQKPEKADLIVGLGSHDLNTANRVCDLYLEGYAPIIIFSGYHGYGVVEIPAKSEAEKYKEIALSRGISPDVILMESKSTNTGDNIKFTQNLVLENKIKHDRIIVVHKPYMERRTYATFKKNWAEPNIFITSPQVSYEEYMNNNSYYDKEKTINIMVGDLLRIKEYPKLSFQIEQEIPGDVWQAGQELIKLGYNKYLLK